MSATKRLKDCPTHKAGWTLVVNGVAMPPETEWEATSRFGGVLTAVVVDKDGKPVFDRPAYIEAPNVNVVAYGRDRDGKVRVAVIRQPRPHADDPQQPGVDGHSPVVFGQLPMGFLEKILGESMAEAAKREVGEETGASAVLRVTQPAYPWHNPNPTFVKTWSDLFFVEVDLEKIEALKADHSEPIYSAEYVPVRELLQRVREGKDHQGAVYRMSTANSLWFIFFATFPELWQA